MSNQITAKQHFIPKFYLKYFADDNNFLQIYDLENNRFGKPRPYAGLGYEKFYYANKTGVQDKLSQEVENWLQHFETILSQEMSLVIPKIINMEHLSEGDKYSLAAFMCFIWLRAPQMRSSINKMRADVTKQIMKFGVEKNVENFIKETEQDISNEQKESIIKTFKEGKYGFKFSNAHHIKMMIENLGIGDKGFTNLFFAKKWKIFISKGSNKFVTSDSPVVEWWRPPDTFWGVTFLERNNYFSLTPDIFIELSKPLGSKKINRKALFDEDKDLIKSKNIMIASHAKQYFYSGDKNIVKAIADGRNKPGPTEIKHYKKFELPWKEYRLRNNE